MKGTDIMEIPFPSPSPDALESQRRYAALVYNLRGYLAASGQAYAPEQFEFEPRAVTEGGTVQLKGEFGSAPLIAQINNVQLKVHGDRSSGKLRLSIVVPVGAPSGRIRLVWPDKTLVSEQHLQVNRRFPPIILLDEIAVASGQDGFLYVRVPELPERVQFGGIDIGQSDFQWTHNNQDTSLSMLAIRLPENAPDAQLVIRTARNVYQSSGVFPVSLSYSAVTNTTAQNNATS
jgi:hypothetical protein